MHARQRVDPGELERWVGDYATILGHIHVMSDRDQLSFDWLGRRFLLRPVREGGMGIWTELWGFWDTQPGDLARQRFSVLDVDGRTVGV